MDNANNITAPEVTNLLSQTTEILIGYTLLHLRGPRRSNQIPEHSKGNLTRPIHSVPQFVKDALHNNGLDDDFNARPAYQQNDYIGWITRAKRPETQLKRLNQMLHDSPDVILVAGDILHPTTGRAVEQNANGLGLAVGPLTRSKSADSKRSPTDSPRDRRSSRSNRPRTYLEPA